MRSSCLGSWSSVVFLVVILLSSCADSGLLSDAYPRFSLVGAPDRDLSFEYAISGPLMRSLSGVLNADAQPTVVQVPAGPNRLIEVLSVDDVYSGRTTADLPSGITTTVTIRLFPGPVIVDYLGKQIVQIRDLTGAGERRVTETDLDGTVFAPVDATYDSTGALWVASYENGYGALYRFTDLSRESVEFSYVTTDGGGPLAIAVDPVAKWVFCAIGYPGEYVYIARYGFDGEPDFQWEIPNLDPLISVNVVSGMTVDANGNLHVFAGDLNDLIVGILTFDGATGELIGDFVPLPGEVPSHYMYMYDPPPIGDILAAGEDLFVVSAVSGSDVPTVFRYDLQLELKDSFGTKTESDNPSAGEFWGPRRFAATRDLTQLMLIDQREGDFEESGSGRVVGFHFGTSDDWMSFGESGIYGFYDTELVELFF